MHCPTLTELPLPPPDKTGWPFDAAQDRPWTEESLQQPDAMPDGSPWPRVSIVTPSYNQAQFVEETIRSVLLQGYPNLEYIIIDGSSTDGSVEIIRKYEPWLAHWVSEPDDGQSAAINKGFVRSTGEIIAWLNSDDIYEPGALRCIGEYFIENPLVDVVYGDDRTLNQDGSVIETRQSREFDLRSLLILNYIPQPSTFVRRSAVTEEYLVDETLHCIMDWDLWIRLALRTRVAHIPRVLSSMRFHQQAKSVVVVERFNAEIETLLQRVYSSSLSSDLLATRRRAYAMQHYRYGVSYFDAGKMQQARRAFFRSLKADMLGPNTIARVGYLVGCLLPRRLSVSLRRWIHRLRWPAAYEMFHKEDQ